MSRNTSGRKRCKSLRMLLDVSTESSFEIRRKNKKNVFRRESFLKSTKIDLNPI